jgi:flavin reductase (DIM6/NTAB) family NADH-FMN oxidoreductase RutF
MPETDRTAPSRRQPDDRPAGDLAVAPVVDVDELVADLDYPMLVVTVEHGGDRQGCLVGFASQCSIEPTRFMVWISKQNRTAVTAARADALGVHYLAASDGELARLFGEETGDDVDKFSRCEWHVGPWGVPVLDRSRRWYVGRVRSRHDAGDHVGHLLEPVAVHAEPWDGEFGFQRTRDLQPGHGA